MIDQQRKKLIGVAIVVGWLPFAGIFSYFISNSFHKNDFKIFNSAKLSGKIENVHPNKSGDRLRVHGTDTTYHFVSIMNPRNGYKGFSDLAAIGDSVFKAPFSDTIYLFKTLSGKKYHFTFDKP